MKSYFPIPIYTRNVYNIFINLQKLLIVKTTTTYLLSIHVNIFIHIYTYNFDASLRLSCEDQNRIQTRTKGKRWEKTQQETYWTFDTIWMSFHFDWLLYWMFNNFFFHQKQKSLLRCCFLLVKEIGPSLMLKNCKMRKYLVGIHRWWKI